MPGHGRKDPDELRREAAEIEERRDAGGKDPSRVAAGKKAAATRKERTGSAQPGNRKDRS